MIPENCLYRCFVLEGKYFTTFWPNDILWHVCSADVSSVVVRPYTFSWPTIHVNFANFSGAVCLTGVYFLPIKWAIFAGMLCLSAPFLCLSGLLLLRNSLADRLLRILLQMGCFCPFLLFVAKLALQVVGRCEKTLHRRCFVGGMMLPDVCWGGRMCLVCKIRQSVK